MSECKVFWYNEQCELKDPIAVVGLPSVGLVGSIVSSFMARELKLEVVAGMTFTDIPQYTLIQNGDAYPPIRVYAGPLPKARKKKKAAPEGENKEAPAEETVEEAPKKRVKARDIIIVSSEIAPKPEDTYYFTVSLLDIIKKLGAREVVFIDGIPRADPAAKLMGTYSTPAAKARLDEAEIPIMSDGVIRGISGMGMYYCRYDQFDAICIISPANMQLPDPRAAADTIAPLTRLIPKLAIDVSPLFMEADEIEKRIRAQQTQQNMVNQNLYG